MDSHHLQHHQFHRIIGESPPAVRRQLNKFAAQGIHPEQLLQWYKIVVSQQSVLSTATFASPQPRASSSSLHTHTSIDENHKHECPFCGKLLKLPKDFVRHIKQTCSVTQEFRCPEPGCLKTYRRKDRFTNHHRTAHSTSCGGSVCSHADQAKVILSQQSFSCGFCGMMCQSDGYAHHLISHFRTGLTLSSDWKPGPNVPMRGPTQPPQVSLSPFLSGDTPPSNFSALRSGFGLPQSMTPTDADDSVRVNHTVQQSVQYFDTPTSAFTLDEYPPIDMDVELTSGPTSSELDIPMGDAELFEDNLQAHDILSGNGDHSCNDLDLFGNDTALDDVLIDPQLVHDSPAVTEARAQLTEFDNVFNPTPPLPLKTGHRRSLSGRLFRALQNFS